MVRRSPHSMRAVRPTLTPAKRKGIPLSPLAQRMLHDMQLAGLSERTHGSDLRAVRKFAQWLNKSRDLASQNDLRRYLLCIKNDQVISAERDRKREDARQTPSLRTRLRQGRFHTRYPSADFMPIWSEITTRPRNNWPETSCRRVA